MVYQPYKVSTLFINKQIEGVGGAEAESATGEVVLIYQYDVSK